MSILSCFLIAIAIFIFFSHKRNYLIVTLCIVLFPGCNNGPSREQKNQEPGNYKTFGNIRSLIVFESAEIDKYMAFSKKAENEGYSSISKLFLAISRSYSFNEMLYLKILPGSKGKFNAGKYAGQIGSTAANIHSSLATTRSEIEKISEIFIKTSSEEKLFNLHSMFSWTGEILLKYSDLLSNAENNLSKALGSDDSYQYYICSGCGNIFIAGRVPSYCELCMMEKSSFICIL